MFVPKSGSALREVDLEFLTDGSCYVTVNGVRILKLHGRYVYRCPYVIGSTAGMELDDKLKVIVK